PKSRRSTRTACSRCGSPRRVPQCRERSKSRPPDARAAGGRGRAGADQDAPRSPAAARPHRVRFVVLLCRSFGKFVNGLKEGPPMARELRCADLIPGCEFVAQGTRDSEVMKKTAEHAKRAHRMIAIAMEVQRTARAAIRDVAA